MPVSSQIVSQDFVQSADLASTLRSRLVASGANRRIRGRFDPLGESSDPAATIDPARHRVDKLQVLETMLTATRMRSQGRMIRAAIREFSPDVVHALRIPYEGIIALQAISDVPVALSCWGQDFSRQAARDPLLAMWVRRLLPKAAGIHVDARVDLERARSYGLRSVPHIHAAGNFGIRATDFPAADRRGPYTVLYPRGLRQYVRHELFLSMVEDLAAQENLQFVGVGLQDDPKSAAVARAYPDRLTLLPELPRADYLAVLRTADVVVSPGLSDGTPNSLLEAMASGASIIAADIPSVRDLLGADQKSNLIDPEDPQQWAATLRQLLPTLEDRRRESEAYSRVPDIYNAATNTARVLNFYDAVISTQ